MQNNYRRLVDKIRGTGFIIPFMWLTTAVCFAGIAPQVMDFYSSYDGFGSTVARPETWNFERVLIEAYIFAVAFLPQGLGALCMYIVFAIHADFGVEKLFFVAALVIGVIAITYDVYTGYLYHADPGVRHIIIFSEAYNTLGPEAKALVHAGLGKALVVDFVCSEVIMAVGWGLFYELLPDARKQWAKIFGGGGPATKMANVPRSDKKGERGRPQPDPNYTGRQDAPRRGQGDGGGRQRPPRPGGATRVNMSQQRDAMGDQTYAVPAQDSSRGGD